MNASPTLSDSLAFGRCTVHRSRRELLVDGVPIDLGGRNYDLLVALIEARGTIVTKSDLMSRVWPRRIVEEGNLQAGISRLRKALGTDRELIRTVAGRGYQFAGEVREHTAPIAPPRPRSNLPLPSNDLVSRDELLSQLHRLLFEERLITLCGAGGIGKTRLAIEVARNAAASFPDGAWLVDLAPLSDPALVAVAVAAALSLPVGGASAESIAQAIATRHLLLVLDNCEHLVEAVAGIVERIERTGSAIHLLCTSREPLKTEGERVYPVPPLDFPDEQAESLDEVLSTGAAKLLVQRARRARPDFVVGPNQAAALGTICRRLDGMPLAIELAAARAAVLGIQEVALHLDQRLTLLTGGARTALPRQQTLRAALDWSYELLSDDERRALRRLAVFAGEFSLDAATALLGAAPDVIGDVASVSEKSLLTVIPTVAGTRYRLLETTRTYALEKLAEAGEIDLYSRRHADHLLSVLARAAEEWETLPDATWSSTYGGLIDDARCALHWAVTRSNDLTLIAELAVAMVPLWIQRSRPAEWLAQVRGALDRVLATGRPDLRLEMKLRAALAGALMFSVGTGPEMDAELSRALEIAERLEDTDYQLTTLLGLTVRRIVAGDCGAALPLAQRHCALIESRGRPDEQPHGDNLMSYLMSWMGDQAGARRCIERYQSRPLSTVHRLRTIGHQYDHRITALGRVLWLEGHPDQALRVAFDGLTEQLATGHALALCSFLATTVCPVALLVGDGDEAARCARLLRERAQRNGLPNFCAWGDALEAAAAIQRGAFEPATTILRGAIDGMQRAHIVVFGAILVATLAEGLHGAGDVDAAMHVIDDAIEASDRTQSRWYLPEQLRIKGELLLAAGGPGAEQAAAECFGRSLQLAWHQGAMSWELRTSMSQARLLRRRRRSRLALDWLGAVTGRFSEGFATADLRSATALIDSLRDEVAEA